MTAQIDDLIATESTLVRMADDLGRKLRDREREAAEELAAMRGTLATVRTRLECTRVQIRELREGV